MTTERPEPAEFVVHGVGYCGGCATYSEAKEAQRINGGGTIYRAIDVHIGDRLLSLESDLAAALARAEAAEARVREWADEYAFERDLASQRGSRITVLEAKVWALIAAGDNLSRWAHHGPACWVTIGGPGDGRCTCGVSEHAIAWKKAKEGQA